MGLDPEGYGNPDFCWLALHDSLVWSLAGPCAAALAVCTGLGAGEGRGSLITLLTPCTPCTPRSASCSWSWQPGPPVAPHKASRKRAQRESPRQTGGWKACEHGRLGQLWWARSTGGTRTPVVDRGIQRFGALVEGRGTSRAELHSGLGGSGASRGAGEHRAPMGRQKSTGGKSTGGWG